MVIAVDIREWQPARRTGIGRVLEEFLRVASRTRRNDRFLLVGDETCEVRVGAANCTVVRASAWTPWWDQVTLPKLLVQHRADVFLSPYIKIPLCAPAPVVCTAHDLTFLVRPDCRQHRSEVVINPLFRLFCRLVVRRAAAVLVDSSTSGQDVRHYLGVEPGKLRVVPLATSPAFTAKVPAHADDEVWRRYHVSPGYLLYVGGFSPHKNVPRLVAAYRRLPDALRCTHPLVLAGGPMSADVQALIQSSGTQDVRWLGVVPDQDLPALYRGAAAFAFPSHYEGFGLPVLEAMACGIAVVCSTAPALVELTGEAAVHVDAANEEAWTSALRALLEDPERRSRQAARGLIRAAAFTPERMTQEICNVIDEVVDREKARRLAHGDV